MDEGSDHRSEAARLMGQARTAKKQEAARLNGKRGGRPAGTVKPLAEIECRCGAGDGLVGHKALCPRARAIKRRQQKGQPLE